MTQIVTTLHEGGKQSQFYLSLAGIKIKHLQYKKLMVRLR